MFCFKLQPTRNKFRHPTTIIQQSWDVSYGNCMLLLVILLESPSFYTKPLIVITYYNELIYIKIFLFVCSVCSWKFQCVASFIMLCFERCFSWIMGETSLKCSLIKHRYLFTLLIFSWTKKTRHQQQTIFSLNLV